MRRAATALLLLLAQAMHARAVQLYYGLDELEDLAKTEIVDKEGRVLKHTLLAFSNHACREADSYAKGFPWSFSHLPGEGFELGQVMVDEPANELMEFFDVQDCTPFIFLPRGAPLQAHKGGKHKLVPKDAGELEEWVSEFARAPALRMTNDGATAVSIFWEAPGDRHEERLTMRLEPGEEKLFDSFLGHTLVWREALPAGTIGKGPLLARVVVTDAAVAAGGLVLSEMRAGKGDSETLQLTDDEVNVWRGRLRTNMSRIRQNERQPATVPTFTDVGFKHMKMPQALHDRLLAFWAVHEARLADEGWHRDDLHVNFYDVMTRIAHTDPATKQAVIDHVQPILLDWIGHADTLDHTSTYGIRRYYNGSRLRDHADIGSTHIISAILNVKQDVDEPWLLHILDHEGRRHFVEMDAGDLVLYESATNVHGRPVAMNGRAYDNIFTHFRPTSWANGIPHIAQATRFHDGHDVEDVAGEFTDEEELSDFSDEELDLDEWDAEEEDEDMWTVHEEMIEAGSLLEEM